MTVHFRLDLPHGRCVGVVIPAADATAALAAASPAVERAYAEGLPETRRPTFLAGRTALGLALADVGFARVPLLPDLGGGPALPAGALGSISHKRTLAVGLAAAAGPAVGLGVDLEEIRPLRADIGPRVLTARELDAAPPAGPARDRFIIERFSLKEAFYKAVNPFVGASIPFHALEIETIDPAGPVTWSAPWLDDHGLRAEGWSRAVGAGPGGEPLTLSSACLFQRP